MDEKNRETTETVAASDQNSGKKNLKEFAADALFIFTGCIAGAFASIGIMIPNGLTSGGITGIARILMGFCDISFSVLYYGLAILVLILALVFLGKREARNILLMTLLYPAVMFVMERIPSLILLEESDLILAAVYFAVFDGVSYGLVLMRGYSFGGADTLAKIVKKKFLPHIDLSKILLVINSCIIVASAFVYGRNIALYALIMSVISTKVMEFVMFGFDTKIVKVEVITSMTEEVADYIMTELERGVSIDSTVGAYTGVERKRLVVYCSPRESMLVKQFVAKHDEKALVTVLHVDTVWGDGFKAIDKE